VKESEAGADCRVLVCLEEGELRPLVCLALWGRGESWVRGAEAENLPRPQGAASWGWPARWLADTRRRRR